VIHLHIVHLPRSYTRHLVRGIAVLCALYMLKIASPLPSHLAMTMAGRVHAARHTFAGACAGSTHVWCRACVHALHARSAHACLIIPASTRYAGSTSSGPNRQLGTLDEAAAGIPSGSESPAIYGVKYVSLADSRVQQDKERAVSAAALAGLHPGSTTSSERRLPAAQVSANSRSLLIAVVQLRTCR